ncbi:hypothetical protein ASG11_11355 [Sphingomonas sp. Leaf357]|nr:hypothetical protein ASG11_11355 [Sphingomonas sp. Leaf357]
MRRLMWFLVIACAGFAVVPASARSSGAAIDAIAKDYVALSLAAGERDPGYVDAYFGPSTLAAAAKLDRRTPSELSADAARLHTRLATIDPKTLSPIERKRRAALLLQLMAAQTRMAMVAGKKISFDQEAKSLFGVTFAAPPLASFDPILAELDRLVPAGPGTLAERIKRLSDRVTVPPEKAETVVKAAIAECRRRTLDHIAIPPSEAIKLEMVRDKPWAGYNYFQGHAHSLIQVNLDVPLTMDMVIKLGCHEAYPGHHVLYSLYEQNLAKRRGWIEYTVFPLFAPMALIAEGSADYGPDLAFPGDERIAFERDTLFPLAGLDPADAALFEKVRTVQAKLVPASAVIARDYIDGRIDRARAVALKEQYVLVTPQEAQRSIRFVDTYRSYLLNYFLGRAMVAKKMATVGTDPAARWTAFEQLIGGPTTPDDLVAP